MSKQLVYAATDEICSELNGLPELAQIPSAQVNEGTSFRLWILWGRTALDPVVLLDRLQSAEPDRFSREYLQTLRQRVQQWRGIMANNLVYAASEATPP